MKAILATTAMALVLSNAAYAESHVTAETETEAEVTAEGTMDATEDAAEDTMEATENAAEDAMAATEDAADSTMETAEDAMQETGDFADDATAEAGAMADDTMDSMSDGIAAPMVTVDGYSELAVNDITAEMLTGARVFGTGDEDVGEVNDVVISDDGEVTQIVIDAGGFLGIGEKRVALDYDSVQILKETEGDDLRVYVNHTQDQLTEMPEYEEADM